MKDLHNLGICYAGIGSRKTPDTVLDTMRRIGHNLAKLGLILRSGHADGADLAFEHGCVAVRGIKQIFLPWENFNCCNIKRVGYAFSRDEGYIWPPTREAMQMAAQYHPAWHNCSDGAKKMHARNCHQVLGYDLKSPSAFVICWCNGSGGTTQAIRIADAHNVPVFNLYSDDAAAIGERIRELLYSERT